MAKFKGSNDAKAGNLFPTGAYDFKIQGTDFDPEKLVVTIAFATDSGTIFREKFYLSKKNGEVNEFKVDQLLRIIMYAKKVDGLQTLDTDALEELHGCYIKAEVVHEVFDGRKMAKTNPFSYQSLDKGKNKPKKKVIVTKFEDEDEDDDAFFDDDDD